MSADGVRLFRCQWLPDGWTTGSERTAATAPLKGPPLVVVVHGYGDHSGRYAELAGFLVQKGMAVLAQDSRGHGQSGGQRGYVSQFDEYVRELSDFIDWVSTEHTGHPLVVLGHSNGGLIALRAVQQRVPGVDALIVTSPLLRLQSRRKPLPDSIARLLAAIVPRLPLPNGLDPRDVTHDEQWVAHTRGDRLCLHWATPGWYWQALIAGQEALAAACLVELPTLIVSAEADSIAEPTAIKELFDALLSGDKQHWVQAGSFHEPLHETNRLLLFESLAEWIATRLNS